MQISELKNLKQWVCYKKGIRNGKVTKIPVNPHNGFNAQTNNPETWGTYAEAKKAREERQLDGIGFILCGGFFGIDLDHVIDESGNIADYARDIIETVDSYTEVSPSETGIHIICRGTIPTGGNRNQYMEIYQSITNPDGTISNGRYFTVTENFYNGIEKPIEERTEQAKAIHSKYFKEEPQKQPASVDIPYNSHLSDSEVIEKASNGKNGDRFTRLFEGDTSKYNYDHSAADLAFCNDLAYWCKGDREQIDRIYRQSALYATQKMESNINKWDKKHGAKTYGEMTIDKALENFTPNTYTYTTKANTDLTGTDESQIDNNTIELDYIKICKNGSLRIIPELLAKAFFEKEHYYIRIPHTQGANTSGTIYLYRKAGYYKEISDKSLKAYLTAYYIPDDPRMTDRDKHLTKTVNEIHNISLHRIITDTELQKKQRDKAQFGLIPFKNCIYNLITHEILPHDPKYMFEFVLNVDYLPEQATKAETFCTYIDDLTEGDAYKARTIYEWLGAVISCLPAKKMKRSMFLLYGESNAGKSQLLGLLQHILGDLNCGQADMTTLEEKHGSTAIVGKRLVYDADMQKLCVSSDGIIKKITGGDPVRIEPKFCDGYDYIPNCLLFFICNDRPIFYGRDKALFNRLITLEVHRTEKALDAHLLDKMQAETQGILQILLDSAERVAKRILDGDHNAIYISADMMQAVEDYRIDGDSVTEFLKTMCVLPEYDNTEERRYVSKREFYNIYKGYCQDNSLYCLLDNRGQSGGAIRFLQAVTEVVDEIQGNNQFSRNKKFEVINKETNTRLFSIPIRTNLDRKIGGFQPVGIEPEKIRCELFDYTKRGEEA